MPAIKVPHDYRTEQILQKIGLRELGIEDSDVISAYFRFMGEEIRGVQPIVYLMDRLEYEEARFYSNDCTIRLYIDWHLVGVSWIDGSITIGTHYQLSNETLDQFFQSYDYVPDVHKLPYPSGDAVVETTFGKHPIKMAFKSIQEKSTKGLIEWVVIPSQMLEVGGKLRKGWVDSNGNEIRKPSEVLDVVSSLLEIFEKRQLRFGENVFDIIDQPETYGDEFRKNVKIKLDKRPHKFKATERAPSIGSTQKPVSQR